MKFKNIITACFVFISLNQDLKASDNCIKVRAALDIGSGTTKIKVAKVDLCTQKILEIYYKQSKAVTYIDQIRNEELDGEIQIEGINAVLDLKKQAIEALNKKVNALAKKTTKKGEKS